VDAIDAVTERDQCAYDCSGARAFDRNVVSYACWRGSPSAPPFRGGRRISLPAIQRGSVALFIARWRVSGFRLAGMNLA
jgi:hypothetical protein